MKKLYIIISIIIAFAIGFWISPSELVETNVEHTEINSSWTCSMHPQIQLPEFGQCPICFMDLIPSEAGSGDDSNVVLTMSNSARKLAEIQTTTVNRTKAIANIKLSGMVAFDKTKTQTISAWADGRITKLFIDFVGSEFENGDALYSIYSPQIISAQEEFVQLIKSQNSYESSASLLNLAKEKLYLLGMTISQIDDLKQSLQVKNEITIYSQNSGTVISLYKSSGEYVKTGSSIFLTSDLHSLWLELDAHENEITMLKIGQTLEYNVNSIPGKIFKGIIDFIQPNLSKSRTVKVRVNVDNSLLTLKPKMFVTALVNSRINNQNEVVSDNDSVENPLLVPVTSVLRTGTRAIVYLQDESEEKPTFFGETVTLGHRVGENYIVLKGLNEGDVVVTNGVFKIDSALQLKGKTTMMNPKKSEKVLKIAELKISQTLFTKVIEYYLDLQEYLSVDDYQNAYSSTMEIHKLTMGVTGAESIMQPMMKSNLNIMELRISFREISDVLRGSIEKYSIKYTIEEHQCMMKEGGFWLQLPGKVINPYYGKDMLPCHAEITRTFGGK
jgi:membrane fusion protein, copper/silver efflux system